MAGDPVVARLASNNQVTNQGGRAWYEFRFTANEANDRWFSLSSPGAGTFTFTFKTSPDANSPVELPLQGALTQAAWLTLVRKVLESNFYLMEHYTVRDSNNGGPAILLEAINPGTSFHITANAGTCVNFALVTSNTGANRTQRDNFRILVETYVRQNLNFRRKGTGDLLAVDVDGIGFAQVEAYLEERPINQFAWPPLPINPASFRNQLANAAYIRWAESYGLPEQIQRLTSGDEFVVLQGRLPNKRKVAFYNQYANWQVYFQQTKRFLTWQPLVKEVYADQPEKLYWFHFYEDRPQYKIRVRRVLQNGTSTTIDHLTGLVGTPYTVCEIETSPSILAPGIADLAELHVWVAANDNTILSAVQSYIIKPKPAQVQYFFFENSFGAFDTVAFTGVVEETDDYQREVEEVYQPQTFRAGARRMRSFRTEQREEFTTHSGYTTDNEILDWYDDLLNSPAPYEVIGNQLHEVVIESGKVLKRRTEEFVKAISFTYRRMAPIQVYRTVPAGIFSSTPVIDPGEPSPPFPPQIIPGLGGFDEFYLPGNSWLPIPNPVTNSDDFAFMIVVRPELGNRMLFSHSTARSQVWINLEGTALMIRPNNAVSDIQINLPLGLLKQYYLLELLVQAGAYSLRVNGSEISSGGLPGATSFSFNRFGSKGTVGYFNGRISELKFGNVAQIDNDGMRLEIADRYGLAVDGARWLSDLDDDFREFVFAGRFTRDQVINRDVFRLPVTGIPVFTPAPGSYAPFQLNIASPTPGAVIHFTNDLSDPTFASPIVTGLISVNQDSTFKAFAVAPGQLPSPIASASYLILNDPDAVLFLQNAGITNPIIQMATVQLFITWKGAGIWNACRLANLMVGANESAHALNARSPINATTQPHHRLTFNGGWTHDNLGALPNGINAFANPEILASQYYNTSTGISMFALLASPKIGTAYQAIAGHGGVPTVLIDHVGTNVRLYAGTSNAQTVTKEDALGFWGFARRRDNTGGNQLKYFNNLGQVITVTETSPASLGNQRLYIGARNNGSNVAEFFSTQRFQFFFIGNDLTAFQMETLRTSVLQFNQTVRGI